MVRKWFGAKQDGSQDLEIANCNDAVGARDFAVKKFIVVWAKMQNKRKQIENSPDPVAACQIPSNLAIATYQHINLAVIT